MGLLFLAIPIATLRLRVSHRSISDMMICLYNLNYDSNKGERRTEWIVNRRLWIADEPAFNYIFRSR